MDGLEVPHGRHGQLPHLEGEQVVDAAVGGDKGGQASAAAAAAAIESEVEYEAELERSHVKGIVDCQ